MTKFTIEEGNTKDFEAAMAKEMAKPIDHFEHELVSIRTSRAHPDMLKEITVSAYEGSAPLPLNQVAAISTPDARSILIQMRPISKTEIEFPAPVGTDQARFPSSPSPARC